MSFSIYFTFFCTLEVHRNISLAGRFVPPLGRLVDEYAFIGSTTFVVYERHACL